MGQLFGAVFGTTDQASEQAMESDWSKGRRPFEQRREVLEERIDVAVRNGSLSRGEADQMRREYNDIVRLEAQYSATGPMSQQQRTELRTRYRALAQRVRDPGSRDRFGSVGYQHGGVWRPLSSRKTEFEQRVALGLRNRDLAQSEATRLRADWQTLTQIEASYRRGGFDTREQADLWARYNAIEDRLGGGVDIGFGNDRNTLRWSQLERRLAAAERNGSIRSQEAVQVRAQLSDLARLDAAYAVGGISVDERAYLTRRYNELVQLLPYNRP